jgi:hypothetical protein
MPDDRHRTPSPSHPPARPRSTEEAIDRLQALETRVLVYEERVNQRLNTGAATLAELQTTISDLKPKRQALVPWVAVAIALGGVIFRAGNYPDRSELDRVNERLVVQLEGLRGEVRSLEREMVRWRAEREAEEADEKKTGERLDRLEQGAGGRRQK